MKPIVGPVFTNPSGRPYKPSGLCSVLRPTGGIAPYQSRHTFAQHTSETGKVPIEVLARLMGHTDTQTTVAYFKVRDRHAREATRTIMPWGTATS
jgi:integrase